MFVSKRRLIASFFNQSEPFDRAADDIDNFSIEITIEQKQIVYLPIWNEFIFHFESTRFLLFPEFHAA